MSQNDFIVGVELGSSKFRGIAARETAHTPDGIEIAAFAEVPSQGVRKGAVVDVTEASRALVRLRDELSSQLGEELDDVVVAVGGAHLASIPGKGLVAVARADSEIGEEDVRRVQDAAQAAAAGANREVLHILEREYSVDAENGIRDPRGMRGARLALEALVIAAASSHLRSLEESFGAAGMTPSAFIATPIAAARGVLNPRQKELGTLLIDIGGGTTDFAVFEEGRCLHAGVVPIGGAYISNDIAIGLRIPVDTAEDLKHSHGVAHTKAVGKRESLDVANNSFTRKQLADVIEARLVEIFDLITKELETIGRARLLPGGVVLSGGSARIPEIEELAKARFRLPSAIGMPRLTTGPLEVRQDPAFATAVGLVLLAAEETPEGSRRMKLPKLSFPGADKIKDIFRSFLP